MFISLIKDGIKSFDPACQTCIQPDWSKEGIGYLLLQKHCQCAQKSPVCCKDGWKLMFAGSQFMNNAERKLPILKIVLIAAHANAQYQDLLHIISIGFPKRHNETEPAHLREFWEVRHRLAVFDGVALLDQRLVFPFIEKCDLEQPSLSQPRCYGHMISCKLMCTLYVYIGLALIPVSEATGHCAMTASEMPHHNHQSH